MFWGLLNSAPELCERLRLGLRVKPFVPLLIQWLLTLALRLQLSSAHSVTLNPSLAAPVELIHFIIISMRASNARCSAICPSIQTSNSCRACSFSVSCLSSLSQKLSRGSSITSSLSAFATSLCEADTPLVCSFSPLQSRRAE